MSKTSKTEAQGKSNKIITAVFHACHVRQASRACPQKHHRSYAGTERTLWKVGASASRALTATNARCPEMTLVHAMRVLSV